MMKQAAVAMKVPTMFSKMIRSTFSTQAIPTTELFSNLKTGPMKRLYKYYTPDAINIAGGVPMDSVFPMKAVTITLEDGKQIECRLGDNLVMNYQRGDGTPGLRDWIAKHVAEVHNVPANSGSGTCMTVGSTDAYAKIIQLVDTDVILLDEFAYGTAVAVCRTLGKQPVGVPMDEHGIIPDQLEAAILAMRAQNLKVNLLYLVPTGQNPTGYSIAESRKKEVLHICQTMGVTIIEDDAYYYLHYGSDDGSAMPGIRNLPTSFYELDLATSQAVTGAPAHSVLRLDSLSKFIAPGMRLGWIAGPQSFIEKYQLLQEMTSQFPAGLTQSVLLCMLRNWEEQELAGGMGLHAHVQDMQQHYKDQRDVMLSALKEYFPADAGEYNVPTAGMFMWLKLHTKEGAKAIKSFEIFTHLANNGVIVVPGGDFFVPGAMGTVEDPSIVRLTFAAASPTQIRQGIQRMCEALKTLQQQQQQKEEKV